MALPLALFAAGTALSVFAQVRQSKAEEASARQNADAARLQAKEILERSEINIADIVKQGERFKAEQTLAGVAQGSFGAGKFSRFQQETDLQILTAITNARREASFNAEIAMRSSGSLSAQAEALRKNRFIGALGSSLSGAGSFMKMLPLSSSPTLTPEPTGSGMKSLAV